MQCNLLAGKSHSTKQNKTVMKWWTRVFPGCCAILEYFLYGIVLPIGIFLVMLSWFATNHTRSNPHTQIDVNGDAMIGIRVGRAFGCSTQLEESLRIWFGFYFLFLKKNSSRLCSNIEKSEFFMERIRFQSRWWKSMELRFIEEFEGE